MVDSATSDGFEPVLSRPVRIAGIAVGLLALTAGAVAVFGTDNEVGSAALLTAGVAIAGLAVFGNRIEAFEAAGVRLELVRQARDARQEAEQARAAGEPDRAELLERRAQSLLVAASGVGSRYEQLRTTEPSGWDRTARMEQLLREARALDTEILTASQVAGIFASGSDGDRVTALALIERNPRLATADVLVDAITNSRSAFEQYHALVAADRALDSLLDEERMRIRDAVESLLAGPIGQKTSDRRTAAQRILKRFTTAEGV